jgi:hypothetical protein
MDAERFDRLLLALTRARTRRSVLGLLAALGLTGLVARDVVAQDCAANGTHCGRAGDLPCCSGWCKRKRGTSKRFCRQAPGQGICTIEADTCVTGSPNCDAASSGSCHCWVTSRGFSVCATSSSPDCLACESHADCEKRPGVGQPGDRCVVCQVLCAGTNNRGCVHRCPNPAIL